MTEYLQGDTLDLLKYQGDLLAAFRSCTVTQVNIGIQVRRSLMPTLIGALCTQLDPDTQIT